MKRQGPLGQRDGMFFSLTSDEGNQTDLEKEQTVLEQDGLSTFIQQIIERHTGTLGQIVSDKGTKSSLLPKDTDPDYVRKLILEGMEKSENYTGIGLVWAWNVRGTGHIYLALPGLGPRYGGTDLAMG